MKLSAKAILSALPLQDPSHVQAFNHDLCLATSLQTSITPLGVTKSLHQDHVACSMDTVPEHYLCWSYTMLVIRYVGQCSDWCVQHDIGLPMVKSEEKHEARDQQEEEGDMLLKKKIGMRTNRTGRRRAEHHFRRRRCRKTRTKGRRGFT